VRETKERGRDERMRMRGSEDERMGGRQDERMRGRENERMGDERKRG
jgi:hypothetical protein